MLGQQQSSIFNNISSNYQMPTTPFTTGQPNTEEEKKHTTRAWVT
mgnify:CR=1 FL=1